MRILLTGGLGFIGQRVAVALAGVKNTLVALDCLLADVHPDPERSVQRFAGTVLAGDVRETDVVAQAMRGCDLVVHMAALTGVGQSMSQAERYSDVNLDGSLVVADCAIGSRTPMVFFSSRAVYGEGAYVCPACGPQFGEACCSEAVPVPSREADPMIPISTYARTKAEAETELLGRWPTDLPFLIVRPQNVIGSGQAPGNPYTGVLAAFVARVFSGAPMQIFGDGSQTRDYVHVSDVSDVIEWAATNPFAWPPTRVLNIGTGRRTSLRQLADVLARRAGDRLAAVEHVDVLRPGDVWHACADVTELRRSGAPVPTRSVEAGVGDFLEWAQSHDPSSPELWDHALDEALRSVEGGA